MCLPTLSRTFWKTHSRHSGPFFTPRDHGGRVTVDRALGASAGAVIAVALLLPDHISTATLREKFFTVARDAESRPFGAFNPK